MSVNVNIFNFNSNGVQPDVFSGINGSALSGVNDILSDIFNDFAHLFDSVGSNFSGHQSIAAGGCVVLPAPFESSHPQGSLKTDGSVITTPGGYKIEATGQFEWTITGPDGKTTRVWGDPHVAEGDGGKWDFKRNSTFVLGDGTRVNVSTAPFGNNGMTVTSGLEIISGNDRVTVSGIDKGKGVVGQVTPDGYAHSNTFGGNDVFVMGSETDDWSFQGKEIIGSNNGGESFRLGGDLPTGSSNGGNLWAGFEFNQLVHNFVNDLINDWNQDWQPNQIGANPYYNGLPDGTDLWAGNNYKRPQHQNQMRRAFRLFGEMFSVLARLASLTDQMTAFRSRAIYA
jgi:hypothetical protein